MRLNEQELNVMEYGLEVLKENLKEIIKSYDARPPVIDEKYLCEGRSIYEANERSDLEQVEALLKRIEEVR